MKPPFLVSARASDSLALPGPHLQTAKSRHDRHHERNVSHVDRISRALSSRSKRCPERSRRTPAMLAERWLLRASRRELQTRTKVTTSERSKRFAVLSRSLSIDRVTKQEGKRFRSPS